MRASDSGRVKRSLYVSSWISGTGNWLTSLVIFMWVFEVTKSATWMSVAVLCHRLPLTFGAYLFSGRTEDRPATYHAVLDVLRFSILSLMALIVWHHSGHGVTGGGALPWIFPFLLLSIVRSLTSGSDGAMKSKILAESLDKEVAARAQEVLQMIFGATGLLASVFFILGVLQVNFLGVLVFDALTFLVSAFFIWPLRRYDLPGQHRDHAVQMGRGIRAALAEAPSTWHLIFLHSLRIGVLAAPMQASLLLFREKFGMGPESAGYLYAILTFAWFAAARLQVKKQFRIERIHYVIATALIMIIGPILWMIDSVALIVLLSLVIWFYDGLLLATFGSSLQRESSTRIVARVFSSATIISNLLTVTCGLVLGVLSDAFGFSHASLFMSAGGIIALLAGEWMFSRILGPLGYFFFVRAYARRIGESLTVSFFSSNLAGFLKSEGSTGGVGHLSLTQATLGRPGREPLSGFHLQFKSDLRTKMIGIQIASVEAYERLLAREKLAGRQWSVYSNGVASHFDPEIAKSKARAELLERDSALAHFYTERAPLLKFVLSGFDQSKAKQNGLDDLASMIGEFETISFFRLYSPDPNLCIIQAQLQWQGRLAIGWSSGPVGDHLAIMKSFSEALSAMRIHFAPHVSPKGQLRSEVRSRTEGLNRENFLSVAEALAMSPSELQIASVLVIGGKTLESQLTYCSQAVECASVDELVASQFAHWYAMPNLSYTRLESDQNAPLFTIRAEAPDAFIPIWPSPDVAAIESVAESKGLRDELRPEKLRVPTIVY